MGLGYPKGPLSSRSIIKKSNYALIAPEGLVKSNIFGFENCEISILASPRLGANFADYIVKVNPGGKNLNGFGGCGIETFVYCIFGELKAFCDKEAFELSEGGYLYCPPDKKMYFENNSSKPVKLFLYKQRYIPIEGLKPLAYSNNVNNIDFRNYEDMENVHIKDLLPMDMSYDMNFHILSFDPGGCHPMIETHYVEHGAYILTGEGIYNLDNEWIPVKKDDYIYMSAYSLQAAYGVGREPFSYVYSKDCNRDVIL